MKADTEPVHVGRHNGASRRRRRSGRLRGVGIAGLVATAILVGGPTAALADHQHGYNVCLNQGHSVYQSSTFDSPRVGWVSYEEVWHHYDTEGNWSLGYVRGRDGVQGYIPKGTFQYETGHDAMRCH